MVRSRRSSPTNLEPLESRILLSNVTATLTNGGDLVVNGDNDRNVFSIRKLGNQFRIDGQAGTTINGSLQTFLVEAASDDLRISLKGGYNSVFVNVDIVDDVMIKGGKGVDEIWFGGDVGGNVGISTSNGKDTVFLRGSAQNVSVKTGNGADKIAIPELLLSGDLNIATGKGADEVTLSLPASVPGVDVGDDLTVQTGSGDDQVLMRAQIEDQMKIKMGSGDDLLAIEDSILGTSNNLDGGSGDDVLILHNLTAPPNAQGNFRRFEDGVGDQDIPDAVFEALFDEVLDPFSIFVTPIP
ncbi:MAG: hypothetical protein AB8G99_08595 [Planctomycetaceae bacterium]